MRIRETKDAMNCNQIPEAKVHQLGCQQKKVFVFYLASIFVSLAVASAAVADGTRRPNIIYIMTDDLGYGDLGCYGQKVVQTPNLDKMAAEGMRFTDHYAGHTVCRPSRLVLWTGQHVGHTGLTGNRARSLTGMERTVGGKKVPISIF